MSDSHLAAEAQPGGNVAAFPRNGKIYNAQGAEVK
jgi:hypothetical protein